jgi:hypothetical protein
MEKNTDKTGEVIYSPVFKSFIFHRQSLQVQDATRTIFHTITCIKKQKIVLK